MSTVPSTQHSELIVHEPHELQLIANSREQMAEAQKKLAAWAERKMNDARAQMDEASQAKTVALAAGFATDPFTRAYQRGLRLYSFYEKIAAAIAAGYAIIPDFPVDVFAVRTRRMKPPSGERSGPGYVRDQQSEGPPLGEGEYRDSEAIVYSRTYSPEESGTGKAATLFHAGDFQELIDFPLSVAKPEIMSTVAATMQQKIFDEIGVLPDRKQKKKDPIVVGIIRDPRSTKWNRRRLMFLLAWYLDTRTL